MNNLLQDHFHEEQGILVPDRRPQHRNEEFDEQAFDRMIQMQREHFWYRGRHKLLLNVFNKEVSRHLGASTELRVIDLGGGCGGWLEYLNTHCKKPILDLALGDSSIRALTLAEPVVGSFATRYQVDLMDVAWSERWDAVFLLDVLEHIPDHVEVLRQLRKSLRPGGLLFITTPALKFFWTYNDELASHQRRYSKQDYAILAQEADLKLLRTDYFMFFLSPALFLSRTFDKPKKSATPEEVTDHLVRTHRIPSPLINKILEKTFSLEAALVNRLKFPWGTSILAVYQR